MIEIPEAIALSQQISDTLIGKKISKVLANGSPHKFAWFFGEPEEYHERLAGKTIDESIAFGGYVEIILGSTRLVFGDGVNLKVLYKDEKIPKKHQLLIEFEDNSLLIASVQMYGGMWCFEEGEFENIYYEIAKEKPSPLSEKFDYDCYKKIISHKEVQNKSAKALLATEQRIPGLGNGVLHDILFNAKINPKRKVSSFSQDEIDKLYESIKSTLHEMTLKGGRDTEKDLFGCSGGYKTILSKKTYKEPCKICGGNIIKKAYLGGSIYYCESCQPE